MVHQTDRSHRVHFRDLSSFLVLSSIDFVGILFLGDISCSLPKTCNDFVVTSVYPAFCGKSVVFETFESQSSGLAFPQP